MKVKASLHIHTKEDTEDGKVIEYDLYKFIDEAAKLNFKVLAITGHINPVCRAEHVSYGAKRGLLVIPGVELELRDKPSWKIGKRRLQRGAHVLLLNCGPEAAKIETFSQLAEYKNGHSGCFVMVAHPNHGFVISLGLKKLQQHQELFDAVEHSWFYSAKFNPNKPVERFCQEQKLPFVSTGDLHILDYLDIDYCLIDIEDMTVEAVFSALRAGRLENVTRAKSIGELLSYQVKSTAKSMMTGILGIFDRTED